jgi:uncharacterized protein (DUF58 family)
MKAMKWCYYTIMSICLIFGMYSGLRIYFIVFFTQLIVVMSMIIVNYWTFRSFSYKQELNEKTCVKGDETSLYLEIVNERPVPLSLIEVKVSVVSVRENISLLFSLAPFSGQVFHIPVIAPYRGRFSVGMTKVKVTDIFGLVTMSFDMRRLSFYRMPELIVLPKANVLGSLPSLLTDSKHYRTAYLRHAEHGDSVSGARLYQYGDAIKHINWKKSAQLGQLFVKQYEFPERDHIVLLVDTGLHTLSGEDALIYADTVCECAACISLYSLSRNQTVSIFSTTSVCTSYRCNAISGFDTLRRNLALLPFKQTSSLADLIKKAIAEAATAKSLFILTREPAPSLTDMIHRVFSASAAVSMVLVGGRKCSTPIHTLSVVPGADAASSLSGML